MMIKSIITCLFFFFAFSCLSQEAVTTVNYSKADSIALNFPKNKYYFYTETAEELVQDLPTEKEKCRAIFRWITNNVRYDFETRNKSDGQEPEVVYKRKKAVCAGYSELFKAMCDDAKIQCLVISGEAEGATRDSHAWNIVKLDGKWYIMDVTWASGVITNLFKGDYKKLYNEAYWMADYKFFTKDHWTTDNYWTEYIVSTYK